MNKFVPRKITKDGAARGYNNEGRGKLIGYIADITKHEESCPYRVMARICNCRIGLWQDKPRIRVKARSVAFPSTEQRGDG